MLKALLKKQLMEIFRGYFYDAKKNTARSKGMTLAFLAMFALLMVGVLGGLFTFLSVTLCAPLAEAGMDWLYFVLMSLIAVALGAFGSVFNTYSGLYLAKDNDLLLSMPIPVHTIMAARLMGVYLMGLMYSGVVIVPAVIVYLVSMPLSLGRVIGSLLLVLLISVFVLTLSCVLGWVVARVSLKLKHKSFTTVLLSVLFMAAYYFLYFKAQTLLSELLKNAAQFGEQIRRAAYPLYLLGRVGTGDATAMLLSAAAVIGLFAALWALMTRSFLKIATASGRTERRAYRERAARAGSLSGALLRKELGRFASSPNYILNCGLGMILLPIAGVAMLVKGGEVIEGLKSAFATDTTAALLCTGVCLIAAMNDMAAPSVSLEGKSLWILRSLPVSPWQALRAKLWTQLLLSGVPTLFCALCACFAAPYAAVERLCLVVLPMAFCALMALFHLTLSVMLPNLSWTNELTPIKQSASVMLGLFGGWALALLPLGGYELLEGALGFAGSMACVLMTMLALCGALYAWLRRQGAARFAAL